MNEYLQNFPKKRSPLNEEYKKIYNEHYKTNREGKTKATFISSILEGWMHRKAARFSADNILEIGAGTLNQVRYEKSHKKYDIIEPFNELYDNSNYLKHINKIYADIAEIPLNPTYEKISSIATLEHLLNLPDVIARTGLLLKKGGAFCFGIPSEGTLLWKLGYTLTTGMEFKRKYGLRYAPLMKHEHVNTAKEIREIVRHFFLNIKAKSFGLCQSVSLYQYYECRNPDIKKCKSFLKIRLHP